MCLLPCALAWSTVSAPLVFSAVTFQETAGEAKKHGEVIRIQTTLYKSSIEIEFSKLSQQALLPLRATTGSEV